MHLRHHFAFLAIIASTPFLAQPAHPDDLNSVLQKLDTAAQDFHTTTAKVEFDTIQTEPIPDKDVVTGTAYYDRQGSHFQMAAHLKQHNDRPTAKTYMLSSGLLRVSDTGKESDAKAYPQASKFEGYLILGFGAKGSELAQKWTIKYLGTESIDGIKTDKLELVAKDPSVRKTIPKVTVWMDTARAVSLRQVFDEGEGQSYICNYTDIKVNQPLPKSAFAFDK
jgi:hypothetical protein